MTPEARVMRELRLKHQLSMKAAANLIGVSDSFISHIENGRVDLPKGEGLLRLLKVYGNITPKYFGELVRENKQVLTDLEIVQGLLPKIKPDKIKLVRAMVEQIVTSS